MKTFSIVNCRKLLLIKIITTLVIIITNWSCNETNSLKAAKSNPTLESAKILSEIKKVEYKNVDLLKEQVQLLYMIDDELMQLYAKYYDLKANFLIYYNKASLKAYNSIYDELKEQKLYKLMAEIDLHSTYFHYEFLNFDIAASVVNRAFDYCFESEMFLERQALIYGISPTALINTPKEKNEELLKVVKEIEKYDWSFYHSRITVSLAKSYYFLKKYKIAKDVLLKNIKKCEEHGFNFELANNYNALSLIDEKLSKDYHICIENYKRALDYTGKYGSKYKSMSYRMIGHKYFTNKCFDDAYNAYKLAIQTNDFVISSLGVDYAYAGWAYFQIDKKNNFEKANKYYDKALELSSKGSEGHVLALERKIWSLNLTGKKDEVEKNRVELLQNRNLLQEKNNKSKFKDFQTNTILGLREKNFKLNNLERTNKHQEAQLKNQRVIRWISFILILMSVILFYLLYGFRKNLKKNKLLNKELETSIIEIKKINLQLEESNKNLQNFALVAAHDIKSPLATISTVAQILSEKYQSVFLEKDRKLQEFIIKSVDDMKNIVNNILEFSKIPKSNINTLEPVNLNQKIKKSIELLQKNIAETQAIVEVQSDFPLIMGRKKFLPQLFINLLCNALKFTRPNIKPKITIGYNNEREGCLTVYVRDNGIGIPKEAQKEIFQLFKKLHRKEDYEGYGIGLAICKRIIDSHGGEIWLESKPNHGTTFFFTLKRA